MPPSEGGPGRRSGPRFGCGIVLGFCPCPRAWSGFLVDFLQQLDIGSVLIQFAVLLFSLSIHEASHAWMADRLGDYTARYLGRVTLNPVAHVDPVGTILFPLLQFFTSLPLIGWAKPVPVDPARLRNRKRDQMLISLAGPGANLLAALTFLAILALAKTVSGEASGLITNMAITMKIPSYPSMLTPLVGILFFGMIINFALALFNLLPVPPLDGHWILYGILPDGAGRVLERLGSYGFLVLYAMMFLGMLRFVYLPVYWVVSLLLPV